MKIQNEVVRFFKKQHYTILSTVGADGLPHSSCKGIVSITRDGRVYLLDLYKGETYRNLLLNPRMSLTAVDEHVFRGFCLKGTGRIIDRKNISPRLMRAWRQKLSSRISHRIIKSLRGEKGHPKHPEALLPQPQYLIFMEVREIADLTPAHIK